MRTKHVRFSSPRAWALRHHIEELRASERELAGLRAHERELLRELWDLTQIPIGHGGFGGTVLPKREIIAKLADVLGVSEDEVSRRLGAAGLQNRVRHPTKRRSSAGRGS